MGRLKIFLLIAVAMLIALEPVAHTHPIGSDTTCAICAAGTQRLSAPAPSVAAPRVVVWTVTPREVVLPGSAEANPLASRAPPVA